MDDEFYAVVNDAGKIIISTLWRFDESKREFIIADANTAHPIFSDRKSAEELASRVEMMNPPRWAGDPACGSPSTYIDGIVCRVVKVKLVFVDDDGASV